MCCNGHGLRTICNHQTSASNGNVENSEGRQHGFGVPPHSSLCTTALTSHCIYQNSVHDQNHACTIKMRIVLTSVKLSNKRKVVRNACSKGFSMLVRGVSGWSENNKPALLHMIEHNVPTLTEARRCKTSPSKGIFSSGPRKLQHKRI
jgi:hypothetical protein